MSRYIALIGCCLFMLCGCMPSNSSSNPFSETEQNEQPQDNGQNDDSDSGQGNGQNDDSDNGQGNDQNDDQDSGQDNGQGDDSGSGQGEDNGQTTELSGMDETWLNAHNTLRNLVNTGSIQDDGTDGHYPLASPAIPSLAWNKTLAQVAQNYAENCEWKHNANRQGDYVALGGENIYIGENIAVHYFSRPQKTAAGYAVDQVNLWWDEHKDWHYQAYNSASINGAGHFTQMIWANTIEVGCGMAFCPNFEGDFDAYFGVCNYSPGGNYIGQVPYQTANP